MSRSWLVPAAHRGTHQAALAADGRDRWKSRLTTVELKKIAVMCTLTVNVAALAEMRALLEELPA